MTRYTGILLARHGETDHNRDERFQGHLPVGLNELGRSQAAALARAAEARGVRGLWSSPLARARETAEIIGARIGIEPLVDERLAEADAGDWTGRLFAEVEAEDPDAFAAFVGGDWAFAFPGGESFADQDKRVSAALDDIAAFPRRPALLVCHAIAIRLMLARAGLTAGRNPAAVPVENADLIPLVPDARRSKLTHHRPHRYKPSGCLPR